MRREQVEAFAAGLGLLTVVILTVVILGLTVAALT